MGAPLGETGSGGGSEIAPTSTVVGVVWGTCPLLTPQPADFTEEVSPGSRGSDYAAPLRVRPGWALKHVTAPGDLERWHGESKLKG